VVRESKAFYLVECVPNPRANVPLEVQSLWTSYLLAAPGTKVCSADHVGTGVLLLLFERPGVEHN